MKTLSKLSKQDITEIIYRMAVRNWQSDKPQLCLHRRIKILRRLDRAHRNAKYDGPMVELFKNALWHYRRGTGFASYESIKKNGEI